MKLKYYLSLFVLLALGLSSASAQNLKPFAPRYDRDLKGDILLIGNNILNRDGGTSTTEPNDRYNGSGQNGDFDMQYIDIDGDATTFNSSRAFLDIPAISDGCYRIAYAGLYWSGILQSGSRADIDKVRLRLPTGGYINITGQVIYDADTTPVSGAKPYASYADITALVQGLANPQGAYTVANVQTSTGSNGGMGLSAGWSIFIVYEDPNLVSKSVVTFDGFSGIGGATTLDVPISGFRTIPVGPVRAKFAFTTLEGDQDITGDYLRINGNTISTADRAANNFFNSSITDIAGPMNLATQRTPNSSNTLGYDAGIITNFNPANSVIANNATNATIRLGSTGDVYFYFFNAFAVDIIEPNIVLTKQVQNTLGQDIGGANVNLCQDLDYIIGFQNTGNDDVVNLTIRDVLPINVTFNPAGLTLPPGVTYTYNAGTRTIVFTVPNNLVNVGDPRLEIRLRVKVVCTCTDLDDACSNVIQNQAFASYQGLINTNQVTDDPSLAAYSACNLNAPSPTNFLVGLDDCDFTRTEVMCGTSVTLTAANGYQSYVWSGPGTITPVPGTNNQSVVVTVPGTYTVQNNINTSPCRSIVETINVVDFTAGLTNPVIPYADHVAICPNDGKQLPYIFLCGAGDSQLIQTNILGAISITWEQLNTASCAAVANPNCANENPACTWTNVGTGPNYNATAAGQYRIIIAFPNGCNRIFYFNVYQNTLAPTFTSRDIICTTPGNITVNNVPPGYEYMISSNPGVWVATNSFTIPVAGVYTISIRQIGVTGGCVFTIPNIPIRARNFAVVASIIQPRCSTDKGSINLTANDAYPQYTFTINQGATVVATSGLINSNNYVFSNLNGGNYTYTVTTQDGCTTTVPFTINTIAPLTVTAALTRPLTCTDGEITVYPVGGTAPYNFIVTGAVSLTQANPVIVAPVAGTYNIQVVDFNNCTATTSITITNNPPPTFTVSDTDIQCATSGNTGSINFNVTNANGYTLSYSITGAAPFFATSSFTNLPAGNYTAVVQYTLGSAVCTSTAIPVTITIPSAITGIATLTQDYTCTQSGIITVSGVGGGTPGYTYSIDGVNFQPGNTFTITAPGSYVITIKDSAGCTLVTNAVVVPALNPPTDLSFNIIRTLSCPSNTVDINVNTIAGGVAPLRYFLISPLPIVGPNASGQFNNLAPGTYVFEVVDRNNCRYQETFTIAPLPPLTVVGQVNNNVVCRGTATGSLNFTVSGFAPRYNYTVTAPGFTTVSGTNIIAPTITLNNLTANTYTVTIVNPATNCTATTTITITEPATALGATINTAPVTCNGNGQVTITATGGWGGYSYSINPVAGSQSNNVFSNLPPNTYTVTTTDVGGCSVTNTFTLVAPTPPTASISAASDFCYDAVNGATLVVTAAGGTPPYQYSINSGPFGNNATFGPLTPGIYNIVVMDSFGCTVALPAETINQQLTLNTVLTKDLDCTGSPNAVITGTITGGYPGYTYQVNINGAGFVNLGPVVGSSFSYSTATAGNYIFQVTDSRGCTAQSSAITINALVPVTASHVVVNNTCFGGTSGTVTITPGGGVGPYTVQFNGVGPFTSTFTYSSLAAGNYTYIVSDSKDCKFNGSFTITQPALINYTHVITPIQCNPVGGYTLGSICVNGLTGGVAPYTYALTDLTNGTAIPNHLDATGANYCFPNLDFGVYELVVTDGNGCSIVHSNLILSNPPNDLTFVITPTIPSCIAGATVSVTVVGLPSTYEFGIMNLPPPLYSSLFTPANNPPFTHIFTGLTPGVIYTFVVRDTATGCYYFETMTAPTPTNSTIVPTLVPKNVTCLGAADGTISGSLAGFGAGATSINYTINYASSGMPVGTPGTSGTLVGPPFTLTNVGPLGVGNYTIYFNEVNGANAGCGVTSAPFTISQSAVNLSATVTTTNDNCNVNAGQIAVSPSGGTAPYTYQYLPVASPAPIATSPGWVATNPFNGESGNYNVYIKDANDCIRVVPATIGLDPTPVVTATLASACAAEGAFSITVAVPTAGIAPYSFSIDGGAFQTRVPPFTITGLSSGNHTVEVKDRNGCGNLVNVNILAPIVAYGVFTTQPTCRTANGQITVTASGGSGTYSYSIAPNAGITLAGNVFSNVAPGNYTIIVTDTGTSCTRNVAVSLVAPADPSFTTTPTPPSCNGGNNGSILVTLTGANVDPVYTYQIIAPIAFATGPQASNVFNNLPAGAYTVQVNSGRGCPAQQVVNITQPTALTATASLPTPVYTCNASNVLNTTTITISVPAGSGTPNYSYSIDGVNYFPTNTFNIIGTAIAQNYTFYVKDANSCLFSGNIVVPAYIPLNGAIAVTQTIDCTRSEIVRITASGGSGSYSYSVLPVGAANVTQGVAPNDNVFTITASGSYLFRITDTVTGCTFDLPAHSIAVFNTIDIVANATTPVTCFDGSNGAITINVTGYAGPYTYTILDSFGVPIPPLNRPGNTAVNPQPIGGLQAGSYTIQVSEANPPFCADVSNVVTVGGPSAALTLRASETANVTCTNDKGIITAIASGGWNASYTYSIVPAATQSSPGVFTGLSAGNYIVTVTDALNCSVPQLVVLTLPTAITTTITNSPSVACNGDTTATINIAYPTGGQGSNYSYSITKSNPAPTFVSGPFTPIPLAGAVISNLGAGTYTIAITDGFNCQYTSANITITEPTLLNASLSMLVTPTCAADTVLRLTANDGTPPYAYSTNAAGPYSVATFNPSININIPANTTGTFSYYVRDANGCISVASNGVTIDPIAPLTLTVVDSDRFINCNGDSTGFISVNATGGLGNYVYTLTPNIGTVSNVGPVVTFSNLPAGNYQVNVTSGNCVVAPTNVVIDQQAVPSQHVATPTHVKCFGAATGAITIVSTGVSAPYQYAISTSPTQFQNSVGDQFTFTGLVAGNYIIYYKDNNGCSGQLNVAVNQPTAPLGASISGIVNEVCAENNGGSFTINAITGGTPPYTVGYTSNSTVTPSGTVTLALGVTSHTFTNLDGGLYFPVVTDANGCTWDNQIPIGKGVLFNPDTFSTLGCDNNISGIEVEVINTSNNPDMSFNPLSDYTFELDHNGTPQAGNNIFTSWAATNTLTVGSHIITVVHTPTGCSHDTPAFTISAADLDQLQWVNLQQIFLNTIQATVSGGTAPYTYEFIEPNGSSHASNTSSPNTFVFTYSGTYTVVVTDNTGCSITKTIPVTFIPIKIPDVYTPGDGGGWAPLNTSNYKNLITKVYDRYGRVVGELKEGEKWYGKYNGQELPTGDYWYVIKVDGNDAEEFVGHFTLYR